MMGHSFGGCTALLTASRNELIKVTIALLNCVLVMKINNKRRGLFRFFTSLAAPCPQYNLTKSAIRGFCAHLVTLMETAKTLLAKHLN